MPIKVTMFNGDTYSNSMSLADFDKIWTDSMKSCRLILFVNKDDSIKYLNPYHIAHVEYVKR